MVMKTLHLTNTRTLMVLISAVSVYNIIVTRSFMENTIPEELRDAAKVDGCGDGYFFFRIVMPLSKAIMAVLVLFLAVSYWNSYFNPMIFLTDRSKYPLALYLREILLTTSTNASTSQGTGSGSGDEASDHGAGHQIWSDRSFYPADHLRLSFPSEVFCQGSYDRIRQRISS